MIESDPEVEEALEQFSEALSSEDMSELAALDPYAFAAEYTTIERMDDVTIDGQTMAVFMTTSDLGALFSSDVISEMMDAQMDAQMSMMESIAGEEMSDEEMEEMLAMQEVMFDGIIDLYAEVFDGAVATSTVMIGMDDGFVHASESSFVMSVNAIELTEGFNEVIGESTGEEIPEMTAEDIGFETLSLDFGYAVELGNFNDVPETDVLPPEDAQLFPLEAMLPALATDF
jgi:hypothetical protein